MVIRSGVAAFLLSLLVTSAAWGQGVPNQGIGVPNAAPATPSGSLPFTPATIFNITDPAYGSKCDGTTNDAVAINSAIAAASAGGGRVIMPAGRTCGVASRISNTASHVSLECSSYGSALTSAGLPCALKWVGGAASDAAVSAAVNAAGTGYVPGDSVVLAGGSVATSGGPASVYVINTKVVSATAGVNGTGCTNGTYTVTGTTGNATSLFQASVTVTANVPVVNSISRAGNYITNPTSIASEPVTGVTGCSVQPTLNVVMGALNASVSIPGFYSAVPSNPVAQASTTGAGTGATFTMAWGAAMMQVSAPSGSTSGGLAGVAVQGVAFICDGTGTAAYGLVINSVRFGDFGFNYIEHCSTAGLFLGQVSVTGGTPNIQNSTFHHLNLFQNGAGDGYGVWEQNSQYGNSSFNVFQSSLVLYLNNHGIYIFGSDNETYLAVQENRGGGGTANGVYLTGSPTFATDSNKFVELSAGTGGVYIAGTDTIALASKRQMFVGYDAANSIPIPTNGTGATFTMYLETGNIMRAGLQNGACAESAANLNTAIAAAGTVNSLYCYNGSQGGIVLTDGTGTWTHHQDSSHNYVLTRNAGTGIFEVPSLSIGSASPPTLGYQFITSGFTAYTIQSGANWMGISANSGSNPTVGWSTGGPLVWGTTTTNAWGGFSEKARLSSAGGLSIGTTTDPGAGSGIFSGTLTVGTLNSATGLFVCETAGLLSSGITTCVASDRAVKHDIMSIDDGDLLGKVLSKRGVRFTYNEGKGASGRRIGVIANDWERDFPELVDFDADGIRHFDYAATWGLTVEMVRKLHDRIAELERKTAWSDSLPPYSPLQYSDPMPVFPQ